MAFLTATLLGLAALATTAVGTVVQMQGQQQQAKASQQAEAVRMQAANLDALRRQRETIRQSEAARAQTLATTTSQGAAGPGGSALPGAYGGITGSANNSLTGNSQALQSATQLSAANMAYSRAGAMAGMGAGLSSLGGAVLHNFGSIERVGTNYGMFGSGSGGMIRYG